MVHQPDMVDAFVRMLHDTEAEVREVIAAHFARFARKLPPQLVVSRLLPVLPTLRSDSSHHVRASLASAVMGLAPIVGTQVTIEKLLPLFIGQLQDEFPEVRLNLIESMHTLETVLGVEHLARAEERLRVRVVGLLLHVVLGALEQCRLEGVG